MNKQTFLSKVKELRNNGIYVISLSITDDTISFRTPHDEYNTKLYSGKNVKKEYENMFRWLFEFHKNNRIIFTKPLSSTEQERISKLKPEYINGDLPYCKIISVNHYVENLTALSLVDDTTDTMYNWLVEENKLRDEMGYPLNKDHYTRNKITNDAISIEDGKVQGFNYYSYNDESVSNERIIRYTVLMDHDYILYRARMNTYISSWNGSVRTAELAKQINYLNLPAATSSVFDIKHVESMIYQPVIGDKIIVTDDMKETIINANKQYNEQIAIPNKIKLSIAKAEGDIQKVKHELMIIKAFAKVNKLIPDNLYFNKKGAYSYTQGIQLSQDDIDIITSTGINYTIR